ncbi:MAG: peptide ABC transporter substrate-binding protein [Pyrinomonadaceae bacterium]|nr:peptide ABC transporter substrate-binding protein [Pyrinomonadaceae bacterium]
MVQISFKRFSLGLVLLSLCAFLAGCSAEASGKYWGEVDVPQDNTMRYITGSEPESLDPQFVTGQPEARILIGLFDRLVEYHPKTLEPIPSLATHWEQNEDGTVYTFYMRNTGKFSNGDPIKATDMVWSIRRALSPELASRYAFLGYDIKYGEAYNANKFFVKDKNGKFLLEKDFSSDPKKEDPIAEDKPASLQPKSLKDPVSAETRTEPDAAPEPAEVKQESEFQKFINSPTRLTVPGDEKDQEKAIKQNPKLKAAFENTELVAVTAEDIGVEAVDDYTVRFKLKQSAPYFVGLLTHQFFAALHRPSIEKFGKEWIKPENIVTSGAYRVSVWKPYDEMIIVKEPNYWDAANVKLDAVKFYPMDEQTTMMNIYKSGRIDALYNHTVPAPWNEYIRQYKNEYLLHPEMSIEYYTLSVKKPPVDNLKVRQALSLAIDRDALEKYRKTVKKLVDFTPEGIFPKYEEARKKVYSRLAKENGISEEQWSKRYFDPERARKLLTEAGYEVKENNGRFSAPSFPADDITISYNTAESNKAVAEFVQAQWRQNLGITVPLKNMEWKTYLPYRSNIEYTGAARAGWVGDYVDPFTFLSQFYTQTNDSSTGWWSAKYDRLIEEANNIADPMARFEKLAEAEFLMISDQPIIPLATSGTSWMKKPYIKGFYPNPGTMHPWKFVYIETDPAKWDENVDNIMSTSDPAVDAQVEALMRTQEQFQQSKTSANSTKNINGKTAE